jgi:lysophospholipase L1-like esterase
VTLQRGSFAALAVFAMALGCGEGPTTFPDVTTSGGTTSAGSAAAGAAGVPATAGASSGANAGGVAGTSASAGVGGNSGVSGGGGSDNTSFSGSTTGGTTTGGCHVGAGTLGGAGGAGSVGGSNGAGFAPCPATGACKILPLGDSITDGLTVAGGYRIHLFELAVKDGKSVTYVGGSMNGPTTVAGMPFPRAHEGHSGWTISQIVGLLPSPALDVSPHIVLLHIGTNDMYQNASGADQRLGAVIDQILQTLPSSLLVVSTIIPFPGSVQNVATYNAAVPKVVDARAQAGKHVLFVDQFKDFPTSELADGVHPNSDGYARMANVWFTAISAYLH